MKLHLRAFYRLCWTVVLFVWSAQAISAEKMIIAQAEGHLTHKLAASVIAEAYRRLNITTEFVQLPSKRSMAWANMGKVDAEVGRVAKALEDLPDLLMVDKVPIVNIRGVIVTKDIQFNCTQWSDLKNLHIGIRRGEVYAEKGTKGMSVYPTDSYHQLFSMLNNNHIDIAVGISSSVELELKTAFQNSDLHAIKKPLVDIPLYHLVHKKHHALVPKLNEVLKEMAASGEIKRLQQVALDRMIVERKQGGKF